MCTYKADAKRLNVYVSGKNYKILHFPEKMQGLSTRVKSKEKEAKKIL
jgi:hypothetical protein